jgi:hypothetical protein
MEKIVLSGETPPFQPVLAEVSTRIFLPTGSVHAAAFE